MHIQRPTSKIFIPNGIRILVFLLVPLNTLSLHHTHGGEYIPSFVFKRGGSSMEERIELIYNHISFKTKERHTKTLPRSGEVLLGEKEVRKE